MPSIVTVNVTQTVAPTPSQLQKQGAMISQGATTMAPGSRSILTQPSDLTALLQDLKSLASLAQVAGVATGTLKSTTIAAGVYNDETGQVTLTLTADIDVTAGDAVTIGTATGTGDFADINGTFTADEGSVGTTLKYTIAVGLTMTITGGNVNASLGLPNGSEFWTTVSGAAQAGYNLTALATVATDKTFTYAVASTTVSPATGAPVMTSPDSVELTQMVTTFFAQGSQQAVSVLELGPGTPAEGVTELAAYVTANTVNGLKPFYSYLVPRSWGGEATWADYLNAVKSTTGREYGFTTVTTAEYAAFADIKAAFTMIESPDVPSTEFTAAFPFWVTLNYAPSSTNKVTPLAFSYGVGVTAYPTEGNAALLTTLKAAGVNYVGTGAEGGISNTVLLWGLTMDLRPFNYWYSVDWVQITGSQAIANAVINGSNDPINPLYYNQNGIDRLQQVLASVMGSGISFGLVLGNVQQTALNASAFQIALDQGTFDGLTTVNAVPFTAYTAANPSDYRAGAYNGLSVQYTPNRGFESITFNVNVTDFVTQ